MPELSLEKIKAYRAQTYRSPSALRIKTIEEAVEFVDERGFIFFWPIKGEELPSLWVAAAGDRPVSDGHDDPGHITWGWKDQFLGKRRWYYGRLLRRRNTMVSLHLLPFFYALSPNYGDPEHDYLEQYQQGAITLEEKSIFEALLKKGTLDTLSLRREAHLSSPENTTRFNRALDALQAELKILPVGISQAGAWNYAFIYDLVTRHFPTLQDQARLISEREAQQRILLAYLQSVGAASIPKIERLLGWMPGVLQKTLEQLCTDGSVQSELQMDGEKAPYAALSSLV